MPVTTVPVGNRKFRESSGPYDNVIDAVTRVFIRESRRSERRLRHGPVNRPSGRLRTGTQAAPYWPSV